MQKQFLSSWGSKVVFLGKKYETNGEAMLFAFATAFPGFFELCALRFVHLHPFFPETTARVAAIPRAPPAKSAEQNAAQDQKPQRLTIAERLHRHHLGQDAIPKQPDRCCHEQYNRSADKEKGNGFFHNLIVKFPVKGFQTPAQVLYRVSLSGNQGFQIVSCAVGNFLKSLVFQFVPDKYLSLGFRQFL